MERTKYVELGKEECRSVKEQKGSAMVHDEVVEGKASSTKRRD